MKDLNNYILEKLVIDKNVKINKRAKDKNRKMHVVTKEVSYYICYLEKGPTTYLHSQEIGAYTRDAKGRAEAEKQADKYAFGDNTPGWKRIPGVKTRSQITTLAAQKNVDQYVWH